jgi:hypothetical protein
MRYAKQLALLLACLMAASSARAAVYPFNASFINGGQSVTHPFTLWLPNDPSGPPGATAPVKGVIFILPGSADDWRGQVSKPNFQAAASALGFGLIGANNMVWGENSGEPASIVTSVLDAAAAASGRPELANAPFAAMGLSQGGYNASRISLGLPERAIAFVNIRSAYYPDGSIPFERTQDVMGLSIVGSKDSVVHPGLAHDSWAFWRGGLGGPHAYAVEWNTTHFDTREGQTWDVAWHWIGEAVRMRYQDAGPLSTTPGAFPTLGDVDPSQGWVGQAPVITQSSSLANRTTPYKAEIAPIGGAFPEPILDASWLPSQTAARVYQAFTSLDPRSRPITPRQAPLRFTAPFPITDETTFQTPLFKVGDTFRVKTEIQPYDTFIHGIVLTEVDYYLDEQYLGKVLGDNFWQLDVTFTEPGIHALYALGRDAAGNEYPAFRTVLVAPPVPEPATFVPAALAALAFLRAARCSAQR